MNNQQGYAPQYPSPQAAPQQFTPPQPIQGAPQQQFSPPPKQGIKAWQIALIIVGVIIFCCISATVFTAIFSPSEDTPQVTEPTGESTPEQPAQSDTAPTPDKPKEPETPSYDKQSIPVGQSWDIDGVLVSVDSFERGLENYDGKAAIRITVTFANNSGKTLSLNPFDWKAQTANGVRNDYEIFVNNTDNELHAVDLASGGTLTRNIYFIDDENVVKIIYMPNFFSSEKNYLIWNLE